MQIQVLNHSAIDPDPRNPRQVFDEAQLDELANDIAVNGLLQPLAVRPHPTEPGRFMLIFGERRWRACQRVDVDQVPAIVLEVDDQQALELQIAENSKRADVNPLEEADAYRRLHEEHGRPIEEIAELCGKSKAYVYAAMKLCALAEGPRKECLAGKLDKSRALLIARLPASLQVQACKVILSEGDYDDGGVMSVREAQRYIREDLMVRLADAPFDLRDAKLVPDAGSCRDCDKRSGNLKDVYPDLADEDICTDGECYRGKLDVHWARLKADAETKGRKVIEGDEARNMGGGYKGHIGIDQPIYEHGLQGKTARQVLGDKIIDSAVAAVARTEDGEIRELISRADLPVLLKEAGIKVPTKAQQHIDNGGAAADDWRAEQEQQKQLERTVTLMAREAALARIDDAGNEALWRLLARLAIRCSRNDAQRELMKIHEVKHEGQYMGGQRAELIAFADQLPLRALRDFTVEMLLAEAGGWHAATVDDEDEAETPGDAAELRAERLDYMTGVEHAAEVLGIDLVALADKAQSDLEAARAAKAEKKAKGKAKAPSGDNADEAASS